MTFERIGADARAYAVRQAGFDAMVEAANAAVAEQTRKDRARRERGSPGVIAGDAFLVFEVEPICF